MHQLNFEAISKAQVLLKNESLSSIYHENENNSDGSLNNLLSSNVDLFWSVMHQCFHLTDIIHYQSTHFNHSSLPIIIGSDESVDGEYTGVELQSLYNWCNLGKSTWFINIFTIMHNNSWQANFSTNLQQYLLPILLLVNCFSLITSISGVYQLYSLSSKSNQKVMILMQHQSIVRCYLPATWPLILSYCIFGLLWLILVLGLNMITSQFSSTAISLHSHDFYCRTVTYMTNILRYIPTWLIGLMLCDRAIGEYRNRHYVYERQINRQRVMGRRIPDAVSEDDDDDVDLDDDLDNCNSDARVQKSRSTEDRLMLPNIKYNNTSDTLSYTESNCQLQLDSQANCHSGCSNMQKLHSQKTSNFLLCRNFFRCCCCGNSEDHIRCVFHGIKRTSYDANNIYNSDASVHKYSSKCDQKATLSSQSHSYEQLLKDVCNWKECGLGRVGGLVLLSILTALICLINTHLLWLYKIGKSSKRCMLSAGDAIILSYFYPYLLKICHSILPHMLIFISYALLGYTALRKSRILKTTMTNMQQPRVLRIQSTLTSREVDQTTSTPTTATTTTTTTRRTPIKPPRKKPSHSLFTEPTQLVIYLGIINFAFEFAEIIEWFYMEYIMSNIFQPITNHYEQNFIFNSNISTIMDSAKTSENNIITNSINSNNNNLNVNIHINNTLRLQDTLHSSKGLTESMHRMCSYHLTTGLLRIWASQRFLLTLPILFFNSAKFRHVIQYFFRYYFQTLKIQHLFKISFKAQNSNFQNPPLKLLISSNSNHDNHSNSNNNDSKMNDTINTDKDDIDIQGNENTYEHDTGIEMKRIPRLYCCSCITQPLIMNDVSGR
ncbi:unnamed protein product [Trichobilharzia szidati]|nr:unnamed protein product [Trichobilharzia szidati]